MDFRPISKTLAGKLASLKLKKHRDKANVFVAEGTKCVHDTLAYFNLEYLVATDKWLNNNNFNGTQNNVFSASEELLRKISSLSTPPEVIAFYHRPKLVLDEERLKKDITLLLDGVQDPGNLGTIIRIADWFGVRQIIASPQSADIYNPKTVQATMGSISRVNVFYRHLPEFVNHYHDIPIVGLLLDGNNIYDAKLSVPAFVVMGNEGNGITDELRKFVTEKLLIPSYPPGEPTGESLNVAIATAITLSEFRRRQ